MTDLPPGCRILDLPIRGDERGSLIALERSRDLPFEIARVYYIFGTRPGVSRGFHAHRDLSQMVIAMNGSCRMTLDDGRTKWNILLDRPDKALLISGLIWREMHDFSEQCVLTVLADRRYDPSDYIRDYGEFTAAVAEAG